MPTLRNKKYTFLKNHGFLPFERAELSQAYSMKQMHSIRYLVNIIRARRLYRDNLKSRGFSMKTIESMIYRQYERNHWKTLEGDYSIWALLKKYRKQAIESGDYLPPQKPSGSRRAGISAQDVSKQRGREIQGFKTRIFIIDQELKNGRGLTVDKYENLIAEKERLEAKMR